MFDQTAARCRGVNQLLLVCTQLAGQIAAGAAATFNQELEFFSLVLGEGGGGGVGVLNVSVFG